MSWMRHVVRAGHRADAWRTLARMRTDRLAILTYHGVSESSADLGVLAGLHVPLEDFEAQLGYLAARHPVLPLGDALIRLCGGGALPRGAVAITFDDGYRNNYTAAFPALKRHGLPATIFLSAGLVGTTRMLWHDRVAHALRNSSRESVHLGDRRWSIGSPEDLRRTFAELTTALKHLPEIEMLEALEALEEQAGFAEPPGPAVADCELMDWSEARAMRDSGLVTFGSHTVTHPILSQLTPGRLREELVESRRRIEKELGTPCPILAYPNGKSDDITDDVVRTARDAGYTHALTTEIGRAGAGCDPMRIPRLGVGEHTRTFADFEFQVSGVRARLMAERARLRSAARRRPGAPGPGGSDGGGARQGRRSYSSPG